MTASVSNNNFALARYDADGSLDDGTSSDSTPSDEFGTDGKVLTSIQSGGTAEATAVTILPDGRILVAGSCWGFAVARYSADGVLDSSFGIGGKVTVSDTGMAKSISVMPDGRIIVAGSSNYSEDFQVACLNPDGSLFEQTSIRTDLSGGSDYAESIALSQDGKVVVAGASQIVWEGENGTESKPAVGIARYGVVFERAYRYDGMGRRIVASDEAPTQSEEHFYHSEQWQVLQDSAAQYVWSPVYVDAMVLRDTPGVRLYVQQDAQYNVTAIVSVTGEVLERYLTEAYGSFIVLNPDWSADEDSASDFAWRYLHQGGLWDEASALYHFRNRDYSPTLARWVQPDPEGYIDGMSLYQYVSSSPTNLLDPLGLYGGTGIGGPRAPGWNEPPVAAQVTPKPGRQYVQWETRSSFVNHYYTGGGEAVWLNDVGLMPTFMYTAGVSNGEFSIVQKIKREMDSIAATKGNGRSKIMNLDANFNVDSIGEFFILGRSRVEVAYLGWVEHCNGAVEDFEIGVHFMLSDTFKDPLDLEQSGGKFFRGTRIAKAGGRPYDIYGRWKLELTPTWGGRTAGRTASGEIWQTVEGIRAMRSYKHLGNEIRMLATW